jgi:hypothetical protein
MSEPKTNAEVARGIWDNAQPITGTLVEAYLRSRGITLPEPGPEYLRFASRLRHPNGQFFPARIALPTNPKTGASVGGIQRTFLSWSGDDKAQVERVSRSCRSVPARVVSSASPIRSTAKPLLLGEGVETLLDIGGFESGCFHFFGKSSEGKTTCLRVGGSVWARAPTAAMFGHGARQRTVSKRLLPGLATLVSRSTNLGRSKGANSAKRQTTLLRA